MDLIHLPLLLYALIGPDSATNKLARRQVMVVVCVWVGVLGGGASLDPTCLE